MPALVVDAWAHCGIRKFRPIGDVLRFMDAVGIHAAVLAQPLGDDDNDYLAGVAGAHRDRIRAIGYAAPNAPDLAGVLARLVETGFAGVRVVATDLKRDPSIGNTASNLGLALAVHAPYGTAGLEEALPEVRAGSPIVITHLGMPLVENGRLQRGRELLDLARRPDILVTLSGLAMVCPYPYVPLVRHIRDVVAAFGPTRIMWGSNYPLGEDGEARSDLELVGSGRFCPDSEAVGHVLGGTANEVWFEGTLRQL